MAADEMSDLLTETVTVAPFLGRDSYGTATYGPAVSYLGHIMGGSAETVGVGGVEDASTIAVIVPGNPPIKAGDRLTLPSSFDVASPPIHRVERLTDDRGPHHVRLVCGWEQKR